MESQDKSLFESLLRRVLTLRSLNPRLKQVLQEMLSVVKEASLGKADKVSAVIKLQGKEQRFHSLNKSGGGGYREVGQLKT